MKEAKIIKQKFDAMCKAVGDWRHECAELVKQLNHPVALKHTDKMRGHGFEFYLPEDTRLVQCCVDKVRLVQTPSGLNQLEAHKTMYNEEDCNEWEYVCNFGYENENDIYENLLWITEDDLVILGSDNHDGNVADAWSFANVPLYFVYDDGLEKGMVEEVYELDDYQHINGRFGVHRYDWSQAMSDIDSHYEAEE